MRLRMSIATEAGQRQPAGVTPSRMRSRHGLILFVVWASLTYLAWYGVVVVRHGGLLDSVLPSDPAPWMRAAYSLGAQFAIWLVPTLLLVRQEAGTSGSLRWLTLVPMRSGGLALLATVFWLIGQAIAWPLQHGQLPAPATFQHGTLQALNTLLIGPFMEELLFRGFGLRLLIDSGHRRWHAVLWTALAFAGLHAPKWLYLGHTLPQFSVEFASIVIIGLFLGAVQLRARSLYAPLCVHIANNLWNEGVFAWLFARALGAPQRSMCLRAVAAGGRSLVGGVRPHEAPRTRLRHGHRARN